MDSAALILGDVLRCLKFCFKLLKPEQSCLCRWKLPLDEKVLTLPLVRHKAGVLLTTDTTGVSRSAGVRQFLNDISIFPSLIFSPTVVSQPARIS